MSVEDIVKNLLGQAGLLFALIFILWAGYKRYWVFGWYAEELKARNLKLENRQDRIAGIAADGTALAQRATRLVERQQSEELSA